MPISAKSITSLVHHKHRILSRAGKPGSCKDPADRACITNGHWLLYEPPKDKHYDLLQQWIKLRNQCCKYAMSSPFVDFKYEGNGKPAAINVSLPDFERVVVTTLSGSLRDYAVAHHDQMVLALDHNYTFYSVTLVAGDQAQQVDPAYALPLIKAGFRLSVRGDLHRDERNDPILVYAEDDLVGLIMAMRGGETAKDVWRAMEAL